MPADNSGKWNDNKCHPALARSLSLHCWIIEHSWSQNLIKESCIHWALREHQDSTIHVVLGWTTPQVRVAKTGKSKQHSLNTQKLNCVVVFLYFFRSRLKLGIPYHLSLHPLFVFPPLGFSQSYLTRKLWLFGSAQWDFTQTIRLMPPVPLCLEERLVESKEKNILPCNVLSTCGCDVVVQHVT